MPETNLAFFLVVWTVVFLAVADALIVYFKGVEKSISCTVYAWSKAYPIIPFAVGVLMGHFFWNMNP
jgi:hypothetical protein